MKDLFKEVGKYFFDISKIVLAVAVITPLVKGGSYSYYAIDSTVVLFAIGFYLTYKGVKDE